MTREERNNAIKVLRNFDLNNPKVNSLLFSAEEITNAFDMAIKALEQGDVLDKIKGYIDCIRNTGTGKKKSLEFIEKFIEGLRSEREVSE